MKINEISQIYVINNSQNLFAEIITRWNYYIDTPLFRIISDCNDFANHYVHFKNDVFACTKLIKNYARILLLLEEKCDLEKVCFYIRDAMIKANMLSEKNNLKLGIRHFKIKGDNRFMKSTPKPEDIAERFNKLNESFGQALNENDKEKFIKKCADLHFDFLLTHPYGDGNGRTARILLTLMCASKNILLPSLYLTSAEKNNLYMSSNAALDGNYLPIEDSISSCVNEFYDIFSDKYHQIQLSNKADYVVEQMVNNFYDVDGKILERSNDDYTNFNNVKGFSSIQVGIVAIVSFVAIALLVILFLFIR